MASEKQKMLAGDLCLATGEELAADARRVAEWMDRSNASIARTRQEYRTLLRELLPEVGEVAGVVTCDVRSGATVVSKPAKERRA